MRRRLADSSLLHSVSTSGIDHFHNCSRPQGESVPSQLGHETAAMRQGGAPRARHTPCHMSRCCMLKKRTKPNKKAEHGRRIEPRTHPPAPSLAAPGSRSQVLGAQPHMHAHLQTPPCTHKKHHHKRVASHSPSPTVCLVMASCTLSLVKAC